MTQLAPKPSPSPLLVWLALVTIYLVWGSTYLGIRVVVESMPPLLAASSRFLPAAAIAFGLVVARGGWSAIRVTRAQAGGALFVGACLLVTGNGLVSMGEQTVPSGLTAVLLASIPLSMVIFRVALGERPRRIAIFGVVFGFAGVAVLVLPQGLSGNASFVGLALVLASSISWSIGSVAAPRIALPADSYASSAYQMLFGGLMLGVAGLLLGEGSRVDLAAFRPESFVALAYLILIGSVVAFPAYAWLLQNAPIGKVATYAYVNPVVAVALGALLLQEKLDASMIVGGAMVVAAVVVIVSTESRGRAASAGPAEPRPAAAPAPGTGRTAEETSPAG